MEASDCSTVNTEGEGCVDTAHGSGGDVEIRFCGSTPLLWKVADIKRCREQVGVVGALVGSLARQPRQNVRLGRPLEILQEEAQLLVDTGRATAALQPRASESKVSKESEESHSKAVELYQAISEQSYKEQCAIALQEKRAVLQRVLQEKQEGHSSADEQAVRERLDSVEKTFSFPRSAMLVQLCTARAGYSHCPEEREFLAADRSMPKDERLETRLLVYKDLRRKGFYMTSAGKFGGDYLVYPGDPLRFHAHFIALCTSMDERSPLYDILTIARLGSNVKKTVLLCSPGEAGDPGEDGRVVYSSLQWSGMM